MSRATDAESRWSKNVGSRRRHSSALFLMARPSRAYSRRSPGLVSHGPVAKHSCGRIPYEVALRGSRLTTSNRSRSAVKLAR
ncbi:hypothetical protein FH608_010695 [Nonomuraea phyllanthi]|uniref:Uncharacterized protein n=1 Tax=Nonomuraea phyllanthi TaxID=2219224 RepID=A0A5C4WSE9_9ACTN|nr:hypothetical protein [Nonomuraea phyllanthi]KAB8195940.1 hypothetical protein FH608_010695 [Nonomuraea phyllanthi]